jgi:tetratricopeptide (TPR) repeat protein/V8-like Glu-specific endopeptidase
MAGANPPRTRDELAQRLAQLSFARRSAEPMPEHWACRERVAVWAHFGLSDLEPLAGEGTPAGADAIQKVLAESSVDYLGGQPAWRLRHDARRATLERLAKQGRLAETLRANPPPRQSTLQAMLSAYVLGQAPPLEAQTLDQLEATQQVSEWLAGLVPGLPEPAALTRRLARERLLKPFRYLVGDHFEGRQAELSALRRYVGVLDDEGNPAPTTETPRTDRPLMVFGPGGIGKSTLIASFILEHAELDDQRRFPYAYLDFNRRDVSLREPVTILLEAARQIAIQYPLNEERWYWLRQQWQERAEDFAWGGEQSEQNKAAFDQEALASFRRRELERYLYEFADAARALPDPFLLVLDTLEELFYHDPEYLGDLWWLLDRLRQEIRGLRMVLAGRSPLPDEYPAGRLQLTGLDEPAAVAMLLRLGLPDETLARDVIAVVGRSPLSLWLAADLFRRMGGNRAAFEALEARQEYFYNVKEYLIQGVLYRRILGHLHNKRLKTLAHPGMVLRRITPDLILEVLTPAMEIAVKDLDEAKALFAELRGEVGVVEVSEATQDELRLRPELRLALLELLMQDERARVRKIHTLAVEYFRRRVEQAGPAAAGPALLRDRADWAYHRLALGDDPEFLSAYSLPELRALAEELGGAIQDLPAEAQQFLASRVDLKIQLDPGILAQADLRSWEHATARSARNLLDLGRYSEALALMEARPERSAGSPLYPLQARALAVLKRGDALRQVLEEGIRRTPPNSPEMQALLLQSAASSETAGQPEEALKHYRRARQTAERLSDRPGELQLQLHVLRLVELARQPGDPEIVQERERLWAAWKALDDETLLRSPALIRAVATQAGPELPEVVPRAVRLLGLGAQKPASLDALASGLAAWDDLRSVEAGEAPGMLARAAGAESQGDLFKTWLAFLEAQPWDKIANALMALVEVHVLSPTLAIVLVDLLRARLLLTSEQARLLQGVLMEAFTPDALRAFLQAQFALNLQQVSRAEGAAQQAADLVSWAEATGQMAQLLQALAYERPGHAGLVALLDALQIEYRPAQEGASPAEVVAYYQKLARTADARGDRRAAADALVTLGKVHASQNDLAAARQAFEQALALDEAQFGPQHPRVARDATFLGELSLRMGELDAALAAFELVFQADISVYGQNHAKVGADLINLGTAYELIGRFADARAAFELALELNEAVLGPDDASVASAVNKLGNILYHQGDAAQAIAYFERALAITQVAGDSAEEAAALANLGNAYVVRGDFQRAGEAYERALGEALNQGNRRTQALLLGNLGIVFRARGDFQKAIQYQAQALSLARELGDEDQAGNLLNNLGLAYADIGELERARPLFEQSLQIFERLKNPNGRLTTLGNLGRTAQLQKEQGEAQAYYEQAIAVAREIGDRRAEQTLWQSLGSVLAAAGNDESARAALKQSLEIAREVVAPREEASVLASLGFLEQRSGQYTLAIELYVLSLEIAEKLGERQGTIGVWAGLGSAYLQLGELVRAGEALETAKRVAQEFGQNSPEVDQLLGALREALSGAESSRGQIHIGDSASVTGEVFTGGKHVINTGGGSYYEGPIDAGGVFVGGDKAVNQLAGGDIVGRDKIIVNVYTPQLSQGSLEGQAPAVCLCEQQGGRQGTAFLIGPDLVLTAYDVCAEVVEGRAPPEALVLRFDLVQRTSGEIVSQGRAHGLAVGSEAQQRFDSDRPWLAASNRDLGYALLRLARPAGLEVPGGLRSGSLRGWLAPAAEPHLERGSPLAIIHYPEGRQRVTARKDNAFIGFGEGTAGFSHRLETAAGSRGAPLFDGRALLAGLHLANAVGRRGTNLAATLSAIVLDLKQRDIWKQVGIAYQAQRGQLGGAAPAQLLQVFFQQIQREVDARAETPDVEKDEIRELMRRIETEAAKAAQANPDRLERWLEWLRDMAEDIAQATAAVLAAPRLEMPRAVRETARQASRPRRG